MFNRVFVQNPIPSPIDKREILRYAGVKGDVDEQTETLLNDCVALAQTAIMPRVCYRVYAANDLLAELGVESELLKNKLCKAKYAVVFGASVGVEADRLIMRFSNLSPAKSAMLQAVFTERIESVCDGFCAEIEKGCVEKGMRAGSRFSAGYGDFSIEKQTWFFKALDITKKIGVTLSDGLLMMPTKSVTAIVPIYLEKREETGGCASCENKACLFRKEGE